MKSLLLMSLICSFVFSSDITILENKAKSGIISAKLELGKKYLFGEEVNKDEEKAFVLISESAKKGYPKAKLYLGLMYEKGIFIEQDYDESIKWLKEASKQGESEASYMLANIYHYGENGGKAMFLNRVDLEQALIYYNLAKKQGKESFLVQKQIDEIKLHLD